MGADEMARIVKHHIDVRVNENGICSGIITICHGTIRVGGEIFGVDVTWKCDVTGVDINSLMLEAAKNICVRMAVIRDLPEAREKINSLTDAIVKYSDISTWTTKGQRGRKKFEDMSAQEMLDKMTPAQLAEFKKLMGV
jgi:hypothetical protein